MTIYWIQTRCMLLLGKQVLTIFLCISVNFLICNYFDYDVQNSSYSSHGAPCPARDLFQWLNTKVKVHIQYNCMVDEDNRKEIPRNTRILGILCYHWLCNLSFWWRFSVVTLLFGFFCGYGDFCHMTESDLFLFSFNYQTGHMRINQQFMTRAGTKLVTFNDVTRIFF